MKIILNGEATDTKAPTLQDLCISLGHDTTAIATAMNGEFVANTQRTTVNIKENDHIEIVAPRQGG